MLKVTLITADNLAGTIFTNCLIKAAGSKYKIEKVYTVSPLRGDLRGKLKKAKWLLTKRSKLFLVYKLLIEQVVFNRFCTDGKNMSSLKELFSDNKIKSGKVDDVNAAGFIEQFDDYDVSDRIVISAYGSQIFNKELIRKIRNFYNIHGSYLPFYKGAAPYFWMFISDEYTRGVTLHHVAEDLDAGGIINRVIVDPETDDTLFIYHARCVFAASDMLNEALNEFGTESDKSMNKGNSHIEEPEKKFGLPTPEGMKKFKSLNKKSFKISDLKKIRDLAANR